MANNAGKRRRALKGNRELESDCSFRFWQEAEIGEFNRSYVKE